MSARLITIASIASAAFAANLHDRAFYEAKFFDWMAEHKITATSGSHFSSMIQNFANNDNLIETTNAQKLSYELGHNQFSHYSPEEYKQYVSKGLRKNRTPSEFTHNSTAMTNKATSIDWVPLGAVTPVKDQGQCGSCWTFSTTGAIEGAYYNKNKVLQSFSEQHLVDCDKGGYDEGCDGGDYDTAFAWIKKNGGLAEEEKYPYTSGKTKKDGTCKPTVGNAKATPVKYVDVENNSDDALISALNLGPVAVAVDASSAQFSLYKKGVYTTKCGVGVTGLDLDHAVLAVGYGVDEKTGEKYYKIKNSWGSGWGEEGYIRLVRGIAQENGQCGVLSGPSSYPILA